MVYLYVNRSGNSLKVIALRKNVRTFTTTSYFLLPTSTVRVHAAKAFVLSYMRRTESPLCSLAVRIERGVRGIYFRMYNHARENSAGSHRYLRANILYVLI